MKTRCDSIGATMHVQLTAIEPAFDGSMVAAKFVHVKDRADNYCLTIYYPVSREPELRERMHQAWLLKLFD